MAANWKTDRYLEIHSNGKRQFEWLLCSRSVFKVLDSPAFEHTA